MLREYVRSIQEGGRVESVAHGSKRTAATQRCFVADSSCSSIPRDHPLEWTAHSRAARTATRRCAGIRMPLIRTIPATCGDLPRLRSQLRGRPFATFGWRANGHQNFTRTLSADGNECTITSIQEFQSRFKGHANQRKNSMAHVEKCDNSCWIIYHKDNTENKNWNSLPLNSVQKAGCRIHSRLRRTAALPPRLPGSAAFVQSSEGTSARSTWSEKMGCALLRVGCGTAVGAYSQRLHA